jgi:hypothetical protein
MGTKELKWVYALGKKYFVLGRLELPRQDKNLLYRHEEPNEPTKEGPHPFVLVESPFNRGTTKGLQRDIVYLG